MREAERLQFEKEMLRAAKEARDASPLPRGRLPVRLLLEGDGGGFGARAGGGGGLVSELRGSAARTAKPLPNLTFKDSPADQPRSAKFVPDPRTLPRPDPFAMAEADLAETRAAADSVDEMQHEMHQVRAAAAISAGAL